MIEKQIRVSCSNSINKLKSTVTGKVWRSWRIQIRSIDRDIKSALGVYIDHVEYVLHESFETPRICKKSISFFFLEFM
jgi:transcription initiation factor IIF auxiliary subunit